MGSSLRCRGGHRDNLGPAKELQPEAKPRIISGNGPRFIAKDFKAYVEHYNNVRLNCAIGYITPKDMLFIVRVARIHSGK